MNFGKMRFVAIMLLAVILSAQGADAQIKKITGVRIEKPTKELRDLLESKKIDITGGRGDEYIEIHAADEILSQIRAKGFAVTPLAPNAPLDPRLLSHSEMRDQLFAYQTQYPDIASVTSFGISVANRPMWAIKISDNVLSEEDEMKFLVVAALHGNEVVNVEIAMYEIAWLLENYGTNAEATEFVNDFELWFIPMANPDGRMASSPRRYNNRNIDLNRNYAWGFTAGGSHGAYPESEPETQAIVSLTDSVHFTGTISYHSSGSDVLHPWSYQFGINTPDEDFFYNFGHELASAMGYSYYHPYGYESEGSYTDYMYHQYGTFPFTMETNSSQVPYPADLESDLAKVTVESLLGFRMFLRRLKGPGITGIITDASTGLPVQARVYVVGKEDDTRMEPRGSDPVFGRYYRILEPGTYTVQYSAEGIGSAEKQITLQEDESLQAHNVALSPRAIPVIVGRSKLDGIGGYGSGNGNTLLNRGETVSISISVKNEGLLFTTGVYATLSTADTFLTVAVDSVSFASIPAGGILSSTENLAINVNSDILPGKMVNYEISLYDISGFKMSVSLTDTVQGFFDDMESSDDMGWYHSSKRGSMGPDDWQKGPVYGLEGDPQTAFSGAYIWGNDLGGPGGNGRYGNYSDNYLRMRIINCTGWDRVYLQYYRWLVKDPTDSTYISVNDEVIWVSPVGETVTDTEWKLFTHDISSIAGDNPEVEIMFGLKTDQSSITGGWNLDDFVVFSEPLLAVENDAGPVSGNVPEEYSLLQNYPNPFNQYTAIRFNLPRSGNVEIAVYNVIGQNVRTIVNRAYPAGGYTVQWDGRDDSGIDCATGVYFYRLFINNHVLTRKLLLLR